MKKITDTLNAKIQTILHDYQYDDEAMSSDDIALATTEILGVVRELVAEAKPLECDAPESINANDADPMDAMNFGHNIAIYEYEEALLKALE